MPPPFHIIPTRFLPMSWRSPSTVPTTARNSGLTPAASEDGLQDLGAGLHRPGRDQHLGDEQLALLELAAHHVHGRGHGVEDRLGVDALVERGLGERGGILAVARLHGGGEGGEVGHGIGLLLLAVAVDGSRLSVLDGESHLGSLPRPSVPAA